MNDTMTAGNVAYLAYGQQVSFKNYQGLPMPLWHELPENIRIAWNAAADRAIEWHSTGTTTLVAPE